MSRSGDDPNEETDARFDQWPVDAPDDDRNVSVESRWIGMAGGGAGGTGYVFDPDDEVVYEGELDEDAERVTLLRRSETQPEGDESLGEWMRRVGGDDEWSSLSAYGRGELDDRPVESTFQEKNTTPDQDYAFFGSYTFPGDDGREHTVEREFVVDDADVARPTVTVEERRLVDAGDGEADVLDSRTESFPVGPDHDERSLETVCREWHESHPP
ncbi:hypothetical protein [Candidatus Halobonum tyrrellensis]|uniref:Uncharacterized protein n=1 Tax=Candidatus Halobonum tyrrellensis G22 TaxID=1324957 RepID=V4H8E3_9EURY|nr:hypothetical protein [Candidatus Halobonum tyrrellensis]ESP86960.1 hypothetical protein K933_16907 [Candidatus Halobonum tyrrellensis G22]